MNEKTSDAGAPGAPSSSRLLRWNGPEPVVLALGANQGDRRGALERVCLALRRQGIRPVGASRIFETRPLRGSEGPAYLNACVKVQTSLMPHELLRRCQGVERAFGRRRERRWGARTLDIDLIAYGRFHVRTPTLTVPHPRWFERDFILWGLRDLGVWMERATPAAESEQFHHWLRAAEACILSAYSWPLIARR